MSETGQRVVQGSAWVRVVAEVEAERETAEARVIHGSGQGKGVESVGIQAEGVVSAVGRME